MTVKSKPGHAPGTAQRNSRFLPYGAAWIFTKRTFLSHGLVSKWEKYFLYTISATNPGAIPRCRYRGLSARIRGETDGTSSSRGLT